MGFIDWNAPNAPCVDCARKGCGVYHDQCEAFQEYQRKVKELRAIRFKEGEQNALASRRKNFSRMLDGCAIRTHKRREGKKE